MRVFAYCFLLLFLACTKNPSERIERYGTGAVSRRIPFKDGKKEGIMTDYYADGKLMGEKPFRNDLQHGRTVLYYPSGKIKEVQYYENGLKERGDTLFYEDGRIEFITTFEQNKKHGYLRKWSPEGQLVFESRYAHDTLIEVKGEAIK